MSIHITGLEKYKKSAATTLCLGTFDGYHRGHQMLAQHAEFMVTFNPHPKDILQKKITPRLTTPIEQSYFFPNQLVIEFNHTLSKMPATSFLNDVIYAYLKPREITIGYDFRFGCHGQGTPATLQEWGRDHNCAIRIIEKQHDDNGLDYKSRQIRIDLNENPNRALQLLGHPYLLIGEISHGEKIGRTIGFPTANLHVPQNKCIPKFGVYKSHIIIRKKKYSSITYIGRKPSFNGTHPSIETHILDGFNKVIYGETAAVLLDQFIREEQTFSTKNQLIKQIQSDIQIAYPV
ncbi:MAG: riboflavin biosynthesis protein RibF [Candidatus Marinamargulisbacteria bacterium]